MKTIKLKKDDYVDLDSMSAISTYAALALAIIGIILIIPALN